MSQLDSVVKKYQLKILFEIVQEKPNLNVVVNYMDAIHTINEEFGTNYREDLGRYTKKEGLNDFISEFPLKN